MPDGRLWHGGIPGLAVGDLLLPATLVGRPGTLTETYRPAGVTDDEVRADRVHLTRNRNAAKAFAACYPDGALYTAEPIGDTEPDPDAPEIAVRCEQARITAVYDPVVRWAERGTRWLNTLTKGHA